MTRKAKPRKSNGRKANASRQKQKPSGRSPEAGKGQIIRDEKGGKRFSPPGRGRSSPSRPGVLKGSGSLKRAEKPAGKFSSKPSGKPGESITLFGRIEKNRKGFAFLVFENKQFEDLFLNHDQASDYFHGDRLEIKAQPNGRVLEMRVIQHRFLEMVGRFQIPRSLIYERKNSREEIILPKGAPGAKQGDYIRVKLSFPETGPHKVTGELVEIFGTEIPASRDVEWVASEHGLMEHHSDAVKAEASVLKLEIPGKDLENRTDHREIPFITIDGITARDFDDAVYVEKSKKGYRLWVAIADVSHYVRAGTLLDQEAYQRATSVYFPERAFHMLPRELSENLCSLKPKEPRLAMTARMDIDFDGKTVETQIFNSVIFSRRRATYEEIQDEYNKNQSNSNWEFKSHFELFHILKKFRNERGSIDFELPEAQILVDKDGEPTEVVNRSREDSHRLIEEFMIRANEAVTEWMIERKRPFVYRTHGKPKIEALMRFGTIAQSLGVDFNSREWDEDTISPKSLSELVKRVSEHPAAEFLNQTMLRSMKQAVYSAVHEGHFGLASEAYTHFTSPIRRYPDLIVHRLLKQALLNQTMNYEKQEKELATQCDHSSHRERLAAEAEREIIKIKQIRIIRRRLGEKFVGKIMGMTENGFFVGLKDPYVEGFVAKDSITDDFYEFNEDRMIFYGRKKKRTLKMGDQITVLVVKADLEKRMVDFEWQGDIL